MQGQQCSNPQGLVVGPAFWEDVVLDDDGKPLGSEIWTNEPLTELSATSGASDSNDRVTVRRSGEFNALWIGSTLQSVVWAPGAEGPRTDSPVFAYIRAMAAAAMVAGQVHTRPLRIAVLGVGGGALPMFLSNACPSATVDAVELSRAVLDAAEQHMGFMTVKEPAVGDALHAGKIKAHVSDAGQWIQRANEESGKSSMSAILLDCYDGSGLIPAPLRSRSFVEACRALLAPAGVLVVNLYEGFEQDLNPDGLQPQGGSASPAEPFVSVVKEIFESYVFALKMPSQPQNTILVAISPSGAQSTPTLQSLRMATLQALAPQGILPSDWQHDHLQWTQQ